MTINFDKALGIHQHTLRLRAHRADLLANNIANTDTPNFKARDFDFKTALNGIQDKMNAGKIIKTNANHINNNALVTDADLLYRIPLQPSLDGNTVDSQKEIAEFSENSIRYLASLRFINGRFQGIMTAIRGE